MSGLCACGCGHPAPPQRQYRRQHAAHALKRCERCNAQMVKQPHQTNVQWERQRYCSRACANRAHAEEARRWRG